MCLRPSPGVRVWWLQMSFCPLGKLRQISSMWGTTSWRGKERKEKEGTGEYTSEGYVVGVCGHDTHAAAVMSALIYQVVELYVTARSLISPRITAFGCEKTACGTQKTTWLLSTTSALLQTTVLATGLQSFNFMRWSQVDSERNDGGLLMRLQLAVWWLDDWL